MTYIRDLDEFARRIQENWNTPENWKNPDSVFPYSKPGQTPFGKKGEQVNDVLDKWLKNVREKNVYHVLDNKEHAVYEVDVPGVDKKDIGVDYTFEKYENKTTLTIQWTEHRTGSERTSEIDLSYPIDSISATLDKGVLRIEIKKQTRQDYSQTKVPIE